MLKKLLFFSALIFLLLLVVNCAKRGTPTGGLKDEDPPKFVKATPPNYTIKFEAEDIRIYFDEYVKLNDLNKNLIVSPPMDPPPLITPLGSASKYIGIDIKDTLTPNTTYVFNFGNSIVDNNEGNPFSFFKYVMSTGDYIDSLKVKGQIRDALQQKPDDFVTVMLYEVDSTYSDSIIYRSVPRYVTNTLDSLTTFEITNVKAGSYRLAALKDEASNYTYQSDKDKIGFLSEVIEVPKDTSYTLILFSEEPPLNVARPKQGAAQRVNFGFTGNVDSIDIALLNKTPTDFESLITYRKDSDSLRYWYKPKMEMDSLIFRVAAGKQLDTFYVRQRPFKADSLYFTSPSSNGLKLGDAFLIESSVPIVSVDSTKITITKKDSSEIPFEYALRRKEGAMDLKFKTEEAEEYQITLMPNALTDFFGTANDTLIFTPQTKKAEDYGELELTLEDADHYPYIVQLVTEKLDVQREQYAKEGQKVFKFNLVEPGKYYARLIVDRNANGRYDSGNYLKGRQPEEIIYYPKLLDIRIGRFPRETFVLSEAVTSLPPTETDPDQQEN